MHSDDRLIDPHKPAGNHRVTSLITLALVLALFILLAWISLRYPVVHDWTRSGRHTLADASITVLDNIEGPVSVVSYAREQGRLRLAIERFVDRFRRVKPDITLQFKNPDTVPEEVRELGVSVNGELVIRYQDRNAHVSEANEDTFINALIRLTRTDERWIAFIEGHGERNPFESRPARHGGRGGPCCRAKLYCCYGTCSAAATCSGCWTRVKPGLPTNLPVIWASLSSRGQSSMRAASCWVSTIPPSSC